MKSILLRSAACVMMLVVGHTASAQGPEAATPAAMPDTQPPASPPSAASATTRVEQRRAELIRLRALVAARPAGVDTERAGKPRRVYRDAGAPRAVGLEVSAVFHDDVGFKLFDNSRANTRFGLWLGHDLVTLQRHVILSGELGAAIESIEGSSLFGGSGRLTLDSQTLHAGVSVRWDVMPWLAPHARLWGGASLFQLAFEQPGAAYDTVHATSGFGALGAGVLIHTPARALESASGNLAGLNIGLLLEAGYALRSPIDLALKTKRDARDIQVVDPALGRLDLSGPYIRASLVLRF
jgi:hypothetical protein